MRRWPRRVRVACALTALVGGVVGFVPLFGGPGYELALGYGVSLPAIVAACAAQRTPSRRVIDGVAAGLGLGALVFALGLTLSFLHLLHAPWCEPLRALPLMLLGPGFGCLLVGVLGGWLAELRPGWCGWRRALLGVAAPLASAGWALWWFYASPAVFAYDPFAGYFSGSLYDTVVEPGLALYLYRVGSGVTLCAALCLAAALRRDRRGALRLARRGRGWLVAAALAGAVSAAHVAAGPWLDTWHSAATVQQALGGELRGARCDLSYPRELGPSEVALLARDCEEQLADVERVLGFSGPPRVRAYFFRDSGEKRRLMGAEHTYIAKPWRGEVYLQMASYPHPVLAHELAHVVAASAGRGPFRVAGALGGWLPDPGLVEGLATAAAPPSSQLTDREWARAMRDAGLLPPLRPLFSLSFWGQSSSRAYTVSGAFVGWVLERHGGEVLRRWYGGESLTTLSGESWDALERGFHEALDRVQLAPSAIEYAAARFSAPGMFARRCPHAVDRLRGVAEECVRQRDFVRAERLLEQARALDPKEPRLQWSQANLWRAQGDRARAEASLQALLEHPQRTLRERARAELGDLLWLDGRDAEAQRAWGALQAHSDDEDLLRAAEVRQAAAQYPALRLPVQALLLGASPDERKVPLWSGALLALAVEQGAAEPAIVATASYLLGRNVLQQGLADGAAPWLARAHALREALGPATQRELLRLRAQLACLRRDAELGAAVRRELDAIAAVGDAAPGRSENVRRWLSRCL